MIELNSGLYKDGADGNKIEGFVRIQELIQDFIILYVNFLNAGFKDIAVSQEFY